MQALIGPGPAAVSLGMVRPPLFIGSEIFRHSTYGRRHPLAIPRVSTVIDLARAMGWLADDAYVDSPRATAAQLCRFHDPDYVRAIMDAERDQALDSRRRERFNIGKLENPIYGEVFRRPATACGGSLLAAELLVAPGIVYNPAGGTHHGRPDRASGFCYFNDPVLAILRLLDRGIHPIAYVDIDAHHGDGVEAAFAAEDRVLTISVHEAGRWPFSGRVEDRPGPAVRNLPVPAGFNDSEMDHVRECAILPLVSRHRPAVIVLQCGADALEDDPLSRLCLSNRALWSVVGALRGLAPRLLVLGGGGYNPWSVGRCWVGVWAMLNGWDPDRPPTAAGEAILRALTWQRSQGRNPPQHWFTTLADRPRPGPVRDAVKHVVDAAMRP